MGAAAHTALAGVGAVAVVRGGAGGSRTPGLRLTRDQAETVWRGIVELSLEGGGILQFRAAAVSAMSAWSLLQQHLIPWKKLVFGGHDDWNTFTTWAYAFERRCAAQNYLDRRCASRHGGDRRRA